MTISEERSIAFKRSSGLMETRPMEVWSHSQQQYTPFLYVFSQCLQLFTQALLCARGVSWQHQFGLQTPHRDLSVNITSDHSPSSPLSPPLLGDFLSFFDCQQIDEPPGLAKETGTITVIIPGASSSLSCRVNVIDIVRKMDMTVSISVLVLH